MQRRRLHHSLHVQSPCYIGEYKATFKAEYLVDTSNAIPIFLLQPIPMWNAKLCTLQVYQMASQTSYFGVSQGHNHSTVLQLIQNESESRYLVDLSSASSSILRQLAPKSGSEFCSSLLAKVNLEARYFMNTSNETHDILLQHIPIQLHS